jgi:small subunit ribosomal protein S4
MGDPRRLRKKYDVPMAVWNTDRINEEHALMDEFGLKNIREVWVAKAELRKIRREARKFVGAVEKEERMNELKRRVVKMGYAPATATLEDFLGLSTRDILKRRLQTLVYKNGLANSLKQARQLIVHGFIALNGKRVTAPGMLVPIDMEKSIGYYKPIALPTAKTKMESREEKIEKKLKETISKVGMRAKSKTAKESESVSGEIGREVSGEEIEVSEESPEGVGPEKTEGTEGGEAS